MVDTTSSTIPDPDFEYNAVRRRLDVRLDGDLKKPAAILCRLSSSKRVPS